MRKSRKIKLVSLPSFTTVLTVGVLAALTFVYGQARSDTAGLVGVIGEFAADTNLGCGQRYAPEEPGLVMANVPCGTLVRVMNPANGTEQLLTVTGNRPAFRPEQGRIADVSVATGQVFGLKGDAPHTLIVRVLEGTGAGLKQALPFIPSLATAVAVQPQPYSGSDLHALTLNMLGECQMCGTPGMVAVAQVSRNRLDQRFNGKRDLHGVIFDRNQFSWTRPEMGKPSSKGKAYADARALAERFLNGKLSGHLLAVQYLVGREANHYYAPDVIATPSWGGRKGKLVAVRMENRKEIALFHRFYAYRETDAIGSMIAKN